MIDYYQPWLLPFLKFSKNKLPNHIQMEYYYSFEDALWDISLQIKPQRKLLFLVPDFYCSDVLDNVRLHGHDYIYYPLDGNFQTSSDNFGRYLWLYQPDVAIIFNACGIPNDLKKDLRWLRELPKKTLIIEDAVHQFINPSKIKFINQKHFIIDSLRKVSPVPGSRLFTSKANGFKSHARATRRGYFFRSYLIYLYFRFILGASHIFNSETLVNFAHHKLLRGHDEIIGDSKIPETGLLLNKILLNHFDYEDLLKVKEMQVKYYKKVLSDLENSSPFYQIKIDKPEFGGLHVYPLGINEKPNNKLKTHLKKWRLPIWYKFEDAPWSNHRGVLFLPLGHHIKEYHINQIHDGLAAYVKNHIN